MSYYINVFVIQQQQVQSLGLEGPSQEETLLVLYGIYQASCRQYEVGLFFYVLHQRSQPFQDGRISCKVERYHKQDELFCNERKLCQHVWDEFSWDRIAFSF